jgi:hypothetical protein
MPEDGFRVLLVNAGHIKHVPGGKADVVVMLFFRS